MVGSLALLVACAGQLDNPERWDESPEQSPPPGAAPTIDSVSPPTSTNVGAEAPAAATDDPSVSTSGPDPSTPDGLGGMAGQGAEDVPPTDPPQDPGSDTGGDTGTDSGSSNPYQDFIDMYFGGGSGSSSACEETIFQRSCAFGTCHAGGSATAGLDLSGSEVLTRLAGQASNAGGACDGNTLVVAGDPAASLLFQKISGSPPCGSPMPVGGMLSAADVTCLQDRITELQ